MASDESPDILAQVNIGTKISSKTTAYEVQSILGQGTFGTVAKCIKMSDMQTVALKIMKDEESLAYQSMEEAKTLLKLSVLDPDECNLVRWNKAFVDQGYFCLEFEHLDKSLYDFMMEREFEPLHLKEIRPIFKQLANALGHLKSLGVIHADLKPENVMLIDHAQRPFEVKVIDFGLAYDVSSAAQGSYLQSRPYRSPEIILGLPFTEAIDMWSLGCIAALLYLGDLLFPGESEYDMIRYIVQTLGQMPNNLLNEGLKTVCFYKKVSLSQWVLKTKTGYFIESGIRPKETRMLKLTSLDQILTMKRQTPASASDGAAEMNDLEMFVDMLKGMLHLDAANRLTPRQVMEHPFINVTNISSYVQPSCETLADCQPDSGEPAGGFSKPSSSKTAQPITTPSLVRSNMNQVPSTSPCSSICATSTSAVKSGQKRKADHVDEACQSAKRVKSEQSNQTESGVTREGKRKIDHDGDTGNGSCDSPDPERKKARKSCGDTPNQNLHAQTNPTNPPDEHSSTLHSTHSGVKRKASEDDEEQRPGSSKRRCVIS